MSTGSEMADAPWFRDRIDINETLPCGCKNFDPYHSCGFPVGSRVSIDDVLTKGRLTGTVEKVNADGSLEVRWDGERLSVHVTATAVARRLKRCSPLLSSTGPATEGGAS